MTELNKRLSELSQKCARKKKLEMQLDDLYKQRSELQEKCYDLKSKMWSEKADVNRLEGRSLYAFFYFVIGKKDEMLTKEKEEAYSAKIKYETANAELEAVLSDIDSFVDELKELRNCENEYNAAVKEKAAVLKEAGAVEILALEEQIRAAENIKREINEAIAAGQRAKNISVSILEMLQKAKDWSTYDMIAGDGIISHVVKHNHLNTAQSEVEQLQISLRRFKTELMDIKISADMQVNVDGFLRFADYFFDGLISDFAVRKRINNSVEEVQSTKQQIERVLRKLGQMRSDVESKLIEQKRKYDDMIINA